MGISLQITRTDFPPPEFKQTTDVFDVVLVSFDEIEFPGYDLDADLAAQELGFNVDSPQFAFFEDFQKQPNGFRWVLRTNAQTIYDFLEQHGYASFNHGDFSRSRFTDLIIADIESGGGDVATKLDILRSFVDFSTDKEGDECDMGPLGREKFIQTLLTALEIDAGSVDDHIAELRQYVDFSPADDGLVPQESYVTALVGVLERQAAEDGSNIPEILDELRRLLGDYDLDFDYDVSGPSDQDCEWGETLEQTDYEISIYGKTIIEWYTLLERRIYDPIWFGSSVTDLCEAGLDKACTPGGAVTILDYFDVALHEPDEPDEPEHPVSDDDGEFAVLYERYGTVFVKGRGWVRSTDLREHEIVPYDDESTAGEAIELSTYILERDGEEKSWEMRILVRKPEEEIEALEHEREMLRRQIPLLGAHKVPEPHWTDEWELWDEEE